MPKETRFEQVIPKLYRRKYEDIGMLFWVEAQKEVIPTITVEQAISGYFKFIGFDNFDVTCEKVKLSILRAEFIDCKHEYSKTNC